MTVERRRTSLVLVLAAAVVGLDQMTKTLAVRGLEFGEPVHVVGTFRLNLYLNPGGAFSIGSSFTPFFAVAAAVVVAILLLSSRRATSAGMAAALGMVVGGATGNLVDRVLRAHDGAVIDFLDVQWWPIFNVADVFLTIGGISLLVAGFLDERRGGRDGSANAEPAPADAP
ncbi:MAG: signal peptidase II [Acidimicrobiales bacterium]